MRKKIERETPPTPRGFGPDRVVVVRADHHRKKEEEEEEEDKKKDDVNDDELANGIERAARFVQVFSAHGHVARHERRRGHVLFFPSIDGGSQKRRTRVLVSDSTKKKGTSSSQSAATSHERDKKKNLYYIYLVKVVDVTHVALGLERHRRQSRRAKSQSQSQKTRLLQRCWPSSSSPRRRLHVVVPNTRVCSVQLIFQLKLQKNEG